MRRQGRREHPNKGKRTAVTGTWHTRIDDSKKWMPFSQDTVPDPTGGREVIIYHSPLFSSFLLCFNFSPVFLFNLFLGGSVSPRFGSLAPVAVFFLSCYQPHIYFHKRRSNVTNNKKNLCFIQSPFRAISSDTL